LRGAARVGKKKRFLENQIEAKHRTSITPTAEPSAIMSLAELELSDADGADAILEAVTAALGRSAPHSARLNFVEDLRRACEVFETRCTMAGYQGTSVANGGGGSAPASPNKRGGKEVVSRALEESPASDLPATFESLPTEVLTRLILDAAVNEPCREMCRTIGNLARVSIQLRLAAEACWPEAALTLFPPAALPQPPQPAWMCFEPPTDFPRCIERTHAAMTRPSWSYVRAGASEESGNMTTHFLPRRVFAHSSVIHEGRLYVFGGRHTHSHSNALDVLDLTVTPFRWSSPAQSGEVPPARRQHTACLDASGRMLIVGGGFLSPTGERIYRADMHSLDLRTLRWDAMPAPPSEWKCMAHSCVTVPACGGGEDGGAPRGESLMVYGGLTTVWQEFTGLAPEPIVVEQPKVSSALLRFDLTGEFWETMKPTGTPPMTRFRHTASLIRPSSDVLSMAIWGGFTVHPIQTEGGVDHPGWDERCSNDLFLLSLSPLCWSEVTCSGTPPLPRGGHSATVVGDYIVLMGGCDGGEQTEDADAEFKERDLSTVHALDTRSWEYVKVTPGGGVNLPPRSGHTVHLLPCDGGISLLVLGGRDYKPPETPWEDGQHLGRDDAYALLLT
jgi:hypothetical protein